MDRTKRDAQGRWVAGTPSPNPRGRPQGSGPSAALRAAIADALPQIVAKLTEQALAGDVGAAKALLDRGVAPLRATDEPVALPAMTGALAERAEAIMRAMGEGALTPGQASEVLSGLAALARLRLVDDLEIRVRALEAKEKSNARADEADRGVGSAPAWPIGGSALD